MANIFKCVKNDDVVTITVQDYPDTVMFIFESQNHEEVSHYEVKLINLDQELFGEPSTDFPCVVRMPAIEFARICRKLSQFGDSIVISCTKDDIKFSAFDNFVSANIKLAQTSSSSVDNKEEAVIIDMLEPVTLTLSCRFLKAFIKSTPLANQVMLYMGADFPFVVMYRIHGSGHIRYYLAPIIEEDDV